MHSPRCVPLRGTLPTIVLPQRGQLQTVASGVNVKTPFTLTPEKALVIIAAEKVTVTMTQQGEPSWVFSLSAPQGVRIIAPTETADIFFTCTDEVYGYVEDNQTIAKRYCGDGV